MVFRRENVVSKPRDLVVVLPWFFRQNHLKDAGFHIARFFLLWNMRMTLAFSSLLDLVVGGKIVFFKDHFGAWKAWHFWPEASVVDGVSSMIPTSLWQDDNPYLKISQICHYVIAKCCIIYPDWGMIIIPSLDVWPMRNSGWMTINHHRPQALWDIETAKQPLKSIFRGRGMRLQDHHGMVMVMTWNQHRGPTWCWMLGTFSNWMFMYYSCTSSQQMSGTSSSTWNGDAIVRRS